MTLDSNQIIGGLIGLGLVAKGIAEWWLRAKGVNGSKPAVERGCLLGDAAHDELKHLITEQCRDNNNKLIEVLAILRERK